MKESQQVIDGARKIIALVLGIGSCIAQQCIGATLPSVVAGSGVGSPLLL